MQIEILNSLDEKKWDQFVLNSTQSNYCHLLKWRDIIQQSYKYSPLCLVAKENDEIKGILPLILIKSKIFGNKIVSMPFLDSGGIVAKEPIVFKCFIDYLKKYLKSNQFNSFQLRQSKQEDLGVSSNLSDVTFILKLNKNSDIIWSKLDKKTRNQIRKANSYNLELHTGHQCLKDFYKLYQKSMKRLGTPTHSLGFFQNILQVFPEQTKIFMVKFKNKFIASAILFEFNHILANPWAAADAKSRSLNANNFLYWEIIKYACQNNFKYFDFGRSHKNSGTFHFKKQWSADIKQLFYYQEPFKQKTDREKYRSLAKVWSKLPLLLTNFIGPKLRKYIP